MTKRKVNPSELNKEVFLVDDKKDRLLITKILREYSKEFELNQYDTSITLLRQFQQIITLQIHFIKEKGLKNDFFEFIKSLSNNFLLTYSTYLDFTKRIDKDSIPIF